MFFEELSELLEMIVILACLVAVGGDFNIPVQVAAECWHHLILCSMLSVLHSAIATRLT